MVSYFVPRGRYLLRSVNLRKSRKQQQGEWPIISNIRQTFSVKNLSEQNIARKNDNSLLNALRRLNYSQCSLKPLNKFYSTLNQRHRRIWVKLTLFLLRLTPVSLLALIGIEWQLQKQKCQREQKPNTASEFQSKVYCSIPLRIISRLWGWLASCYIPNPLRPYIFGLYSRAFNVNMEEALYPDYNHYDSLCEFFTRPLKNGVRLIDAEALLISPADGTVLHCGSATNSLIEQVKGVHYSIESFIGPPTWAETRSEFENCDYADLILETKDGSTELYQCVIYLAPGDYHRFHSPTNWKPIVRRHFTGELLSVSPKIATWLPNLFCLNERALYLGKWKHGFFSYTAVGATNVGSLQIYIDKDLKTNRWLGLNMTYKKFPFDQRRLNENFEFKTGDLVGQFNMGSTIVLLFEAPRSFKFNIKPGQKIKVGMSLGSVD